MIGDKYNFELHQKDKALKIAKEISPMKKPIVIGIGGKSGTSKTEIAFYLRRYLKDNYGIRSVIIHQDDYYLVNWYKRNKIRKKTNIIGRKEIDWYRLNKVINSFKNNEKKIYIQEIDIFLNKMINHIVPCRNTLDILMLEGLYACYANVDFKIFLDGNDEDTYKFRKKRNKENPDDKFRQYVLYREGKCVEQSKRFADLIIPYK